jgi:hypothetical protein
VTIDRRYSCNLCRDAIDPNGNVNGIGIYWTTWARGQGWIKKDLRDTENHLCFRCLSSIQAIVLHCAHGVEGCKGGPSCSSDHA